jgi:hypothetical protein
MLKITDRIPNQEKMIVSFVDTSLGTKDTISLNPYNFTTIITILRMIIILYLINIKKKKKDNRYSFDEEMDNNSSNKDHTLGLKQ